VSCSKLQVPPSLYLHIYAKLGEPFFVIFFAILLHSFSPVQMRSFLQLSCVISHRMGEIFQKSREKPWETISPGTVFSGK